jgi:hypothetical protein
VQPPGQLDVLDVKRELADLVSIAWSMTLPLPSHTTSMLMYMPACPLLLLRLSSQSLLSLPAKLPPPTMSCTLATPGWSHALKPLCLSTPLPSPALTIVTFVMLMGMFPKSILTKCRGTASPVRVGAKLSLMLLPRKNSDGSGGGGYRYRDSSMQQSCYQAVHHVVSKVFFVVGGAMDGQGRGQ